MTPAPQCGCDHAIRDEDNQNVFECMWMGDCIHKEVVDRRPLLYHCRCTSHSASSDVLEIIEEIHGLTFLVATQTGNEHARIACNLSADLLRQQTKEREQR